MVDPSSPKQPLRHAAPVVPDGCLAGTEVNPTRRMLFCAAFAGAVLPGTAAMAQTIDEPDVSGELDCTSDSLAAAAEDFGHIVYHAPAAMYRPGSVANVGPFVQWAGRRGHKIVVRGRGHSIYGRARVCDGVVLDMNTADRLEPPQSDRITVDAGATWRSVVAVTRPRGLTPPVLPNYLDLSVGGTLSVGGVGGTTSRHGMLTDNVLVLEVVTGDGRLLACSRESNREIFDAVCAGLGHCAVIVKATLKLMRAPERVRRHQVFYGDLRQLIADQTRAFADDRFDSLQGAIVPGPQGDWTFQLEGALFHDAKSPPKDNETLSDLSDKRPAAKISDVTIRSM
ncbi:FAD-binding protein [Mesorhizobium sp. M0047]|uniref:FAD-binding protein n=1 Tax=Mesorhizobium sp. M0047 TaxID=2956859 RepID=UPI00333619AA